MILMIDNYDSFAYNLVQYIGELGVEVKVVRNDALREGRPAGSAGPVALQGPASRRLPGRRARLRRGRLLERPRVSRVVAQAGDERHTRRGRDPDDGPEARDAEAVGQRGRGPAVVPDSFNEVSHRRAK